MRDVCDTIRERLRQGACTREELPVHGLGGCRTRNALRAMLSTGEVEPVVIAGSGQSTIMYRLRVIRDAEAVG